MEHVVKVRQLHQDTPYLPMELPETDGYIAVPDCGWVGQVVWLRPLGQERWESFLVADCARPEDQAHWHRQALDRRILLEIGGRTAARWDTVGCKVRIQVRGPGPTLVK